MGLEQQKFLTENGVPAHKLVIGHSCGNPDVEYQQALAENGSYVGFDRFGLDILAPDAIRVENLAALIQRGWSRQLVVSHDCIFCNRGEPFPAAMVELVDLDKMFNPTHFHRNIIPQLKERGVTDEQLDTVLIDNPRRYFAGEALD